MVAGGLLDQKMEISEYSVHGTDRRRVSSGTESERTIGFSKALRVGSTVVVAGTTATTPTGPVGGDDVGEQAREVLRRIASALAQVGAGMADVVRTRIYVTSFTDFGKVGRAHSEVFADTRPVATAIQVGALADPGALVEIEVDAVVTDDIP